MVYNRGPFRIEVHIEFDVFSKGLKNFHVEKMVNGKPGTWNEGVRDEGLLTRNLQAEC